MPLKKGKLLGRFCDNWRFLLYFMRVWRDTKPWALAKAPMAQQKFLFYGRGVACTGIWVPFFVCFYHANTKKRC